MIVMVVVLLFICMWNQSFVQNELQASLDHLKSSLWKPVYSLSCPDIYGHATATTTYVNLTANQPPMIIISARPNHLVVPILETWTGQGFEVRLFNTSKMSLDYVNRRCRKRTFKSRLFAIYRQVFEKLLL